jgi:hypothetical protein
MPWTPEWYLSTMPGIPCDQVLAIVRLRQWSYDRQALKTAKTTDYTRTGWKHRHSRTADARIVRVLTFEQAFSRLSQDDQTILAATYRDNFDQVTTAALLSCSPRRAGRVVFIHAGHTVREDGRRNEMQILRLTTPKLMKAFGAPFAQNDTRSGKGCGFPPMLRMDGAPG